MRNKLLPILLAVFALGFAAGMAYLFKTRYEVGDIYPEYSSLRADPLGTMAFYESLDRLHPVRVERDFSSENTLPEPKGAAYLHLAASPLQWNSMDDALFRELERFVSAGGRLVVAFSPEESFLRSVRAAPPPTTGPAKKGTGSKPQVASLPKDIWQFETRTLPHNSSANHVALRDAEESVPQKISWHGTLCFTNLSPDWRLIYLSQKQPVVIERKFGAGSVVMATDCYVFSNEAVLKEPHPDLLAWIIGTANRVYFDEAHLGIVNQGGVAVLMRKYRLHGLLASLLVLALLFIWKNASSLAPASGSIAPVGTVQGKDALSGLVNLLRRNFPTNEVLNVAFELWSKSLFSDRNHSIAQVDRAQAIFETEKKRAKADQNALRAYNEISAALGPRGRQVKS